MDIEIDKEACIGCGVCEQTCPDVFELGDDGKANLKEDADMDADCIQEAADNCPVEAINVS